MKVLVAVDLSPASDKVVAAAGRVATQTGAEVYVLHVAEPEPDFVGYEAGPEVVRGQVAREYREEHRGVQKLADGLRADGIEATALLVRGPTVVTTLAQAEKLGAELIVVGSHGHGAIYDVLVGSYSAGVLRGSSVPVLVVPTREED
jgi:nucleotide-binding universal stress UspA family protein